MPRAYPTLAPPPPSLDRGARMQAFVDALWPVLHPTGVSWLGFYLIATDPVRAREMVLGPRRDKPACSPIGLHGACGRSFTSQRPLVVTDVSRLGAGYIACDPRDRSEVVVPAFDHSGCWGVLDVDSHETAAFAEHDAVALQSAMEAFGLTQRRDWRGAIDTV